MTTRSRLRRSPIPLLDTFYSEFYDDPLLDAFYGGSGYANFGYWDRGIVDAASAGDRLVEKLLELVPRRPGDVLDVACGHGASTRYLARRFEPGAITGIGIVPAQIETCRQRVPECRFEVMDAAALRFPANAFGLIVCVEAAFHFQTRADFLAEAWRVLKPGGCLVLSDLLMRRGAPLVPPENHLRGPSAYVRLLEQAGFHPVTVHDVTRQSWRAFRRAFNRFVAERPGDYFGTRALRDLYTINVNTSWAVAACLLAAGRKPERGLRRPGVDVPSRPHRVLV